MKNTWMKLAMGVALASVSGATAMADETRVRQASQNTQIQFRLNDSALWTTTGFAGDYVLIVRGDGTVLAAGTIGQLCGHPNVVEVVNHSGGQTSLRWCIARTRPELNRGYVRITRNGSLIDADNFVCY